MVLRLNAKGWSVKALADYLEWAESTVRQTIHRWHQSGLAIIDGIKNRAQQGNSAVERLMFNYVELLI